MAGIVSLRRGTPARTPEREALAAAIAQRNAAAALLESVRAQEEKAFDAYLAAVTKRDEAAAVARGAAATYGAHLVNVSAGMVEDAPITPQRARALLADAEDDLETARAVRDGIKTRAGEQENAVRLANNRVGHAATFVLAQSPAIRETVREFARVQVQLVRLGLSVTWLVEQQLVQVVPGTMTPDQREAGMNAARPRIERIFQDRLHTPPIKWAALFGNNPGGLAVGHEPWKAALGALMQNADAPLPTVGSAPGADSAA